MTKETDKELKKLKKKRKVRKRRRGAGNDPLRGPSIPGDAPIGQHAITRVVGRHKDQKRDKLGRWA